MKLRTTALLSAALAPVLYMNAAHAATAATASVSIVKIELIDLDLNDGITPSLQLLTDLAYYERPNTTIDSYSLPGNVRQHEIQWQVWQPLALVKSVGDAFHASTAISGTSLATRSVSAELSVSETGDIRGGAALARSPLQFILSPNSSVSITFDLSIAAALGKGRYAQAWAGAAMIDEAGPWGSAIGPRIHLEHRLDNSQPDFGEATRQQFSGTLISNEEPNHFILGMSAGTGVLVSSVPEPSTWSMLLAGLGLAGAALRRKRWPASRSDSLASTTPRQP